jgi:hypothetical protein
LDSCKRRRGGREEGARGGGAEQRLPDRGATWRHHAWAAPCHVTCGKPLPHTRSCQHRAAGVSSSRQLALACFSHHNWLHETQDGASLYQITGGRGYRRELPLRTEGAAGQTRSDGAHWRASSAVRTMAKMQGSCLRAVLRGGVGEQVEHAVRVAGLVVVPRAAGGVSDGPCRDRAET